MTRHAPKTPCLSAEAKPRPQAGAPAEPPVNAEEKLNADQARGLAEQMLVEGYTFESVLEVVNARADKALTLGEVEHFYRSNLDVQKGRVRHLVEDFQQLKAALGNPETAEGKLAEATFFSGYLNLHRPRVGIGPREAHRARMDMRNLELRLRNLAMKEQRARELHELHRVKIRHDLARLRLLDKKIRQLEALLESAKRGRKLGVETLQRIQEIYGIVTQPLNPPPSLMEPPEGAFADPEGAAPAASGAPAQPPEGDSHE